MVIEAQSPIPELLAKNPVLLAKIVEDPAVGTDSSTGHGDQQKPE
jgi:hypothetical protein